MFAIYVNDMPEGISSYISLFADDAKLLRKVYCKEDCVVLQKDLDKINEWSQKWEMEFNSSKCKIMEFGKSKYRPRQVYTMGNNIVEKTNEEKDLGVNIMDNLSPEKHVNRITAETYNLLRNIKVAFTYVDEEMIKKLVIALIRPRLEYAATVWSPSTKKHIRKLEMIQRAATKLPQSLRDLTYEERLCILGLTTLEQRRERGDLIMIYRVMKGMERLDREDLVNWDIRDTRGHGKKLKRDNCRREIKKTQLSSKMHRNLEQSRQGNCTSRNNSRL